MVKVRDVDIITDSRNICIEAGNICLAELERIYVMIIG